MNRTVQAVIAVVLILITTFSVIIIAQTIGRRWKVDVTDQRIYSLSAGTRAILAKLNQPITAKLYYAKTAALKAPDQIRYFNNYYEFVRALLEEYVDVSGGLVRLEVIDPRPYSKEEEEAMQYGLRRFSITPEENFFFGLVVQTPFGVTKTIPFFSPDRENFVEYDISYLIDTAITKAKQRIGVLSSIPVMGEDISDYMAQMMRMQGQEPPKPWTIIEHLRKKYEVNRVPTEVNDVNDLNDVDLLIVVHPKKLPERTIFAIDQYVLKGGRAVVCVDPYCFVDRPSQQMRMFGPTEQSSDLQLLLRTWGLDMPANTFAGDMALAIPVRMSENRRPEKLIGYMELTKGCFNPDHVITSQLNDVRVAFAGALVEVNQPASTADPNSTGKERQITRIPLVMTTENGNTWQVSSPYELAFPDPESLMRRFSKGSKPVVMGYLVTGKFASAFPEGITIEVDQADPNDPNSTKKVSKKITGLTEATTDCAVVVFSDVDFISNQLAYQAAFFGNIVVGDNSALLMNALDYLSGSDELITIRSRGNFRRPFTVVDRIEEQAEMDTASKVAALNAQIAGYNEELQKLVSTAQDADEQQVVGSTILQKRREIELKIRAAQRELNDIKLQRRERIERLGNRLRQANMFAAPAVILVVAVILGVRRSVRKRHYISHASDA
ncbi:MAG: Gldg family protein [Sedimentisphaerales bacterium]|jgi:ABC-type uncharacterized transport system involved in gliding motility auxiliary subunit|nr:Gldg family protein [Sedimentisphaerales bacterium]